MRKFEHEIKDREIIAEVLKQFRTGVVSMHDGDSLYSIPHCIGCDMDENGVKIYLHKGQEGKAQTLWEQNPEVFVAAYTFYASYFPMEHRYRGQFHDYRCMLAKGKIRQVVRGEETELHGRAVQQMLRPFDRNPNHFNVPHYMFMKLYVVECKWEDVSFKAETPFEELSQVVFPNPDRGDFVDTTPPDFDWFFSKKFFPEPPKADMPVGPGEGRIIDGAEEIKAQKIIVETAWDDKGGRHLDLDAYAYLLNEDGNVNRRYDIVFYNQPETFMSGAVNFLGDDIETVFGREAFRVDLAEYEKTHKALACMLSVYKGSEAGCLGCADNIRINIKDAESGEILFTYKVKGPVGGKHAMQIGKIVCENGRYSFIPEEKTFDEWKQSKLFAEYGLEHWRE